ncbi:hypothetical protein OEZ60_20485 [Defluviimonas sp. WL0024]|uniref:Uncharacterized protein n=1 Tax=Albidovulum salinarum TaxID=2984153 RepID=A0ABT2X8U2_9RHOB|nr:glycosyl hydrolase 108 family protein [Defluviimonas sp. WL0024]MCU9850366.1 hypothetical protein [Defluviimonas sp. WL0024]
MAKADNFDHAFRLVIGEEGAYSNDARDPGGETKYGIAKRYHPDVDIPSLTIAGAKAIYRRDYWDAAGCGLLGWPVAYVFFDAVVNMGLKTAVKLMQEALGEVADGVIGPRTRRAMQRQGDDPELVVRFQAERALYYASRAHFDTYGRGWLRRVIRGAMAAINPEVAS